MKKMGFKKKQRINRLYFSFFILMTVLSSFCETSKDILFADALHPHHGNFEQNVAHSSKEETMSGNLEQKEATRVAFSCSLMVCQMTHRFHVMLILNNFHISVVLPITISPCTWLKLSQYLPTHPFTSPPIKLCWPFLFPWPRLFYFYFYKYLDQYIYIFLEFSLVFSSNAIAENKHY